MFAEEERREIQKMITSLRADAGEWPNPIATAVKEAKNEKRITPEKKEEILLSLDLEKFLSGEKTDFSYEELEDMANKADVTLLGLFLEEVDEQELNGTFVDHQHVHLVYKINKRIKADEREKFLEKYRRNQEATEYLKSARNHLQDKERDAMIIEIGEEQRVYLRKMAITKRKFFQRIKELKEGDPGDQDFQDLEDQIKSLYNSNQLEITDVTNILKEMFSVQFSDDVAEEKGVILDEKESEIIRANTSKGVSLMKRYGISTQDGLPDLVDILEQAYKDNELISDNYYELYKIIAPKAKFPLE